MADFTFNIAGAEAAYPLHIGPGLLRQELPALIAAGGFSRAFVITHDSLAPLYGAPLIARIPGAALISFSDGEAHKNLATAAHLYEALIQQGADRKAVIVALGGGVVGDVAGFIAATYLRGVHLIQAPTTLLAMVDSSIGGKTGVDLPQGKNLVGAFKDPDAVLADTDTLASLPADELRCGLAEVIKAAVISSPALFEHLEDEGPQPLPQIIAWAAEIKIQHVEADRTERGIRAHLNLGHTFAHALEQVSAYKWKHGYAVGVGMLAAARLAARLDLCDQALPARLEALLHRLELPVRFSAYAPADLWAAMSRDKKWLEGQARFILPREIGRVEILSAVPQADVLAVLAELREDAP